jgi:hypothetical protein
MYLQKKYGVYNLRMNNFMKKNDMHIDLCSEVKKILEDQILFAQDANFGALRCSLCNAYHSESALFIYPLAFCASQNQEKQFIQKTSSFGNWICARQDPRGFYTLHHPVIDTAMIIFALAKAYVYVGPFLSSLDNRGWCDSITRGIRWMTKFALRDQPAKLILRQIQIMIDEKNFLKDDMDENVFHELSQIVEKYFLQLRKAGQCNMERIECVFLHILRNEKEIKTTFQKKA